MVDGQCRSRIQRNSEVRITRTDETSESPASMCEVIEAQRVVTVARKQMCPSASRRKSRIPFFVRVLEDESLYDVISTPAQLTHFLFVDPASPILAIDASVNANVALKRVPSPNHPPCQTKRYRVCPQGNVMRLMVGVLGF